MSENNLCRIISQCYANSAEFTKKSITWINIRETLLTGTRYSKYQEIQQQQNFIVQTN